jgi:HSP20 family protein
VFFGLVSSLHIVSQNQQKKKAMYTKRNFGPMPRTIGGLMEDVLNTGWNFINEEVSAFTAPVNIKETDKSYELHVVAPGLKKEDFKLQIDRNILTISYQHKEEENKEEQPAEKWIKNEYRTRSFKRNFTVTDKIDATKISAKYTDGILVVALPKKEITEVTTQEIAVN